MGLRVPLSIVRQGPAVTLPQGEGRGLRRSQTWHGALGTTYLRALFARCGWPAPVVRACGAERKPGRAAPFLQAPHAAAWLSDMPHVGANALKPSSADCSLLPQVQTRCTRSRGRLQQTTVAFLLPPQGRGTGRWRNGSRPAQGGLRTRAAGEENARATAVEAATRAEGLRGRQPLKALLTIFGRHTPWVHEVRRMVPTQGMSRETRPACQQTLGH
jgi:hypothetical protein